MDEDSPKKETEKTPDPEQVEEEFDWLMNIRKRLEKAYKDLIKEFE